MMIGRMAVPRLLLDMAKGLSELQEQLAIADPERRHDIADLLDRVAACLDNIVRANFSYRGQEVYVNCRELTASRRALADAITREIGHREPFDESLRSPIGAWNLICDPHDDRSRDNTTRTFEEATRSWTA
jgi:hypothetical protein